MSDTELLKCQLFYLLFVKKLYGESDKLSTIELLKTKITEIITLTENEVDGAALIHATTTALTVAINIELDELHTIINDKPELWDPIPVPRADGSKKGRRKVSRGKKHSSKRRLSGRGGGVRRRGISSRRRR